MSKDLRAGGLASLTIEDIAAPGFSTPWDAPTVPPFPFSFRDVEVLTLVWRTTEAAVARLLPPPLEPTSDVVLAHIYRMNDTDWLGPYGESNVSVGTRLASADVGGSYSPYLYLSSDVGIVHGREIHGQPKKLGEPRIEHRGDLVVGIVTRNGIDILTGTMAYKQRRDALSSLARHFDVNIPRQSRGLYDVSRSKRLKTPLAWLLTAEGPAVASANTRVFVTS